MAGETPDWFEPVDVDGARIRFGPEDYVEIVTPSLELAEAAQKLLPRAPTGRLGDEFYKILDMMFSACLVEVVLPTMETRRRREFRWDAQATSEERLALIRSLPIEVIARIAHGIRLLAERSIPEGD